MAVADRPLRGPRTGFGTAPQTTIGSRLRDAGAPWRHLDLVMLACVGVVQFIGLLMVFATTRGATAPYRYGDITKQSVFVFLGVLALVGSALIDYRRLRDYALFLYVASIVLLLAVLTPLGSQANGSQSWFQLGSFQLQPSEFTKLAVIIALAAVTAHFQNELDLQRFLILLGMAAVPMALVLLQGDLGTTLVFAVVVPAILLVGGVRGTHLAAVVLAGIALASIVIGGGMLKHYQQERLSTFLNQSDKAANVAGTAYNLNQSKTAIGSGGWFGKGLFEGTQTKLGIVPEQRTDFIFSAVGEQLGFVGGATILALFCIIVWRTWRASQLSRDEFGTLLCVGILAMLLFQIFENVGMTMGIMPVTGIPLPFLSYGGSSTITNFAAIGLVLNVHMRRFS